VFLLEKWGKATKENVDAHVTHLCNNGDEYDLQNLKLLAKYLFNSLDNDMLKQTEQELGNTLAREATGPDVYAAVIALHSVLNDSTKRFCINKLSKHKLIDEPGENVGIPMGCCVSWLGRISWLEFCLNPTTEIWEQPPAKLALERAGLQPLIVYLKSHHNFIQPFAHTLPDLQLLVTRTLTGDEHM
jgi:hypothetical protein